MLEATGGQVFDTRGAEGAQAEHGHRAAGGTVGIEITDHDDAPAATDAVGEQFRRRADAEQIGRRQQIGETGRRRLGLAPVEVKAPHQGGEIRRIAASFR